MNNKPEKQFVILKSAGTIRSLIEDTYSFGGFIAVLWFNHAVLNGNGWLDALFVVGWVLTVAAMQSSRKNTFKSAKEAIKYIEEIV